MYYTLVVRDTLRTCEVFGSIQSLMKRCGELRRRKVNRYLSFSAGPQPSELTRH